MKVRRFCVGLFAFCFFLMAGKDLISYFSEVKGLFFDPATALRGAFFHLLMGFFLAWDAWKVHQGLRTRDDRKVPILYPRAECFIYLGIGLLPLAAAGLYGSVLLNSNQPLVSWSRLFDYLLIGALSLLGAYGLSISVVAFRYWRSLREPRI